MVLVRHPIYVAVGAAVAAYGVVAALDTGSPLAAPLLVLPGGWLAAHGLLNGVAFALDDGDGRETRGSRVEESDGGHGGDSDDGGSGDSDDEEVAPLSSPVVRTPY